MKKVILSITALFIMGLAYANNEYKGNWEVMFRGGDNLSEHFAVERNWYQRDYFIRVVYFKAGMPGKVLRTKVLKDNRSFTTFQALFENDTIQGKIIYNTMMSERSYLKIGDDRIITLIRSKKERFKTAAFGWINRSFSVTIEKKQDENNKTIYRLVHAYYMGDGSIYPLRVVEENEDYIILKQTEFDHNNLSITVKLYPYPSARISYATSDEWNCKLRTFE